MSTSGKIAIGVSIASGVLLAAWLLTGTRKEKTKKLISRGKESITKTLRQDAQRAVVDENEIHYV